VTLNRFFRTPKGLLIVVLAILTVLAALGQGLATAAPGLAGAIVVAALIDAPILRLREGEWVFPDGAMLTGWIVALILSPHEPWYVAAITAAVGVVSKYAARVGKANIFNPAALRACSSRNESTNCRRCSRFSGATTFSSRSPPSSATLRESLLYIARQIFTRRCSSRSSW
jgi:hypothetical protein